ncbi:golgin subfamily A member 6-like protein 22 [Latimeria chalumnae]|uniref:golgin subfamily A member 6-like protein 22 n=1 Tax=Latimeria chalumnae TaxID=7897 RepID=UPI0006D90830|nr:PREDICTED: golgin subfamily A member 6-like protein 22 [Latimeria chalumnae]|eukprot:XP_005991041.2 PREDICTED: golgin subfamily A member 6-like protein 22 [Latimeria chalumnae]
MQVQKYYSPPDSLAMNLLTGELQKHLFNGEYDPFRQTPIFESDFIQVSKKGQLIDIHNHLNVVTLGILATCPTMSLPNIMLLAKPLFQSKYQEPFSVPCHVHCPHYPSCGGSSTLATDSEDELLNWAGIPNIMKCPTPVFIHRRQVELSRLFPLKFVKLSVKDREKCQIKMRLANGRTFYLQLYASPEIEKEMFEKWERLISMLRPSSEDTVTMRRASVATSTVLQVVQTAPAEKAPPPAACEVVSKESSDSEISVKWVRPPEEGKQQTLDTPQKKVLKNYYKMEEEQRQKLGLLDVPQYSSDEDRRSAHSNKSSGGDNSSAKLQPSLTALKTTSAEKSHQTQQNEEETVKKTSSFADSDVSVSEAKQKRSRIDGLIRSLSKHKQKKDKKNPEEEQMREKEKKDEEETENKVKTEEKIREKEKTEVEEMKEEEEIEKKEMRIKEEIKEEEMKVKEEIEKEEVRVQEEIEEEKMEKITVEEERGINQKSEEAAEETHLATVSDTSAPEVKRKRSRLEELFRTLSKHQQKKDGKKKGEEMAVKEKKVSKELSVTDTKSSEEQIITVDKVGAELTIMMKKASTELNLTEKKSTEEPSITERNASKETSLMERRSSKGLRIAEKKESEELRTEEEIGPSKSGSYVEKWAEVDIGPHSVEVEKETEELGEEKEKGAKELGDAEKKEEEELGDKEKKGARESDNESEKGTEELSIEMENRLKEGASWTEKLGLMVEDTGY